MNFAGKKAVVTGGGSGIGQAVAILLAEQGADVVVADISIDAASSVAAKVTAHGVRGHAIACDISDEMRVAEAADEALRHLGSIDILVNNAGMASHGSAEDYLQWDRLVDVNLSGTFYWSRAVGAKCMIAQQGGSIVNVSSIAGMVGMPYDVAYVAAKHGVVGLTRALAVEWAQFGIRVNCVCPGITETPILAEIEEIAPGKFDVRRERVPLGRAAQPIEQARCIAFLASDWASSITGAIVPVDGGQTALSSGWVRAN